MRKRLGWQLMKIRYVVLIFFQKEKSLRAQLPFLPNVAHRFTDDNQLR